MEFVIVTIFVVVIITIAGRAVSGNFMPRKGCGGCAEAKQCRTANRRPSA